MCLFSSYLTDHVDQVEELTEEELGCVPVVLRTVPMLLNNMENCQIKLHLENYDIESTLGNYEH